MASNGTMFLPCWHTSPQYFAEEMQLTAERFHNITNLLLERPNLNSSYLFRADILYDSEKELRTVAETEKTYQSAYVDARPPNHISNHEQGTTIENTNDDPGLNGIGHIPPTPYSLHEHQLERTVIRRLIPRKPQIDRSLEQSCFIYAGQHEAVSRRSMLVIYVPHVTSETEMPWYHPRVKALAYHYRQGAEGGTLTIYYKLFSSTEDLISNRLHRTLLSLLHTFIRLSKSESPSTEPLRTEPLPPSARLVTPAALKDTILPQHVVQDTYTRLKQTYATDLIARWVESTEPSKHVFEDLSIAAFLIELWKSMYDLNAFPGFVDIACGNGVLVYILIKEGFKGHGFDARRRKTWEVLGIDNYLQEMLCIPHPFLDVLSTQEINHNVGDLKLKNGTFDPGVFIISNHADELTPWTPVLAALSGASHSYPHPFLSIPCCSHSLSGAKHRYSLRDVDIGLTMATNDGDRPMPPSNHEEAEQDLASGDLRVLQRQKIKEANHADDKSAYACLTKKTVALAEELGFETEMTLMRIPSTRNIGIVGNRRLQPLLPSSREGFEAMTTTDRIMRLLQRECAASGGVEAAAKIWIERAKKLVGGKGRGKVNLGGPRKCSAELHVEHDHG